MHYINYILEIGVCKVRWREIEQQSLQVFGNVKIKLKKAAVVLVLPSAGCLN